MDNFKEVMVKMQLIWGLIPQITYPLAYFATESTDLHRIAMQFVISTVVERSVWRNIY
jgi:hypothetical protein